MGVTGLGVSRGYRPNYIKAPETELVLVHDIDPHHARAVAEQFGIPRWTARFEDVLAPGLDMLDVSTPNPAHAEQTIAALESGMHVLCQKPMAPTVRECASMVEAAHRAGRQLGMMMTWLNNPFAADLRRAIAEGYLGGIVSARVRNAHRGPYRRDDKSHWRAKASNVGGGSFMQVGIHPMNLALWLLGEEIVGVTGYARNLHCGHSLDGEDVACGVAELGSGALMTLESGYSSVGQAVEIYGTDGLILMSEKRLTIGLCRDFGGERLTYRRAADDGTSRPIPTQEIDMPDIRGDKNGEWRGRRENPIFHASSLPAFRRTISHRNRAMGITLWQYYLNRAEQTAARALRTIRSVEDWHAVRAEYHRRFRVSMGLSAVPQTCPLDTRVFQERRYRGIQIERLVFQFLPQCRSTATVFYPEPSAVACLYHAVLNDEVDAVLLDGRYFVQSDELKDVRKAPSGGAPELLIRAEHDKKAVLCRAKPITSAEPVAGYAHVYVTRTVPPGLADMWERDTRVRYRRLNTIDGVAAYKGSCFRDFTKNVLYFHCSDDRPPETHTLFLGFAHSIDQIGLTGHRDNGIRILRPNTRIRGIAFEDFNTTGLYINAAKVTVQDCSFDNISIACLFGRQSADGLIESCAITDCRRGIESMGNANAVRHCRVIARRDGFNWQTGDALTENSNGILYYFPACKGEVSFCVVKGYDKGIRTKCSGGPFLLQHNTVLDAKYGFGLVAGYRGSTITRNIVADFAYVTQGSTQEVTFDHNVLWNRTLNKKLEPSEYGSHNVHADPLFADPEKDDYRLLPGSPALALKGPDGRPAGALGMVSPAELPAQAPRLTLDFLPDTFPAGPTGRLTFYSGLNLQKHDVLQEKLSAPALNNHRLSANRKIKVRLHTNEAAGPIDYLRYRINAGPWRREPYRAVHELLLPEPSGLYEVIYQVQTRRGVASSGAHATLRVVREPPEILGRPVIRATPRGLAVSFQASTPCFATLEYGSGTGYGTTFRNPTQATSFYDLETYTVWTEDWKVPESNFRIAALGPAPASDRERHIRIRLEDPTGRSSLSGDYAVRLTEEPAAWYVSPAGQDQPDGGAKDRPFKTLQYAADGALPGDRIVLMPGHYAEAVVFRHGGSDPHHPLTVEPETPGTVTLDLGQRGRVPITVQQAPYLTLRNLRLLNYTGWAVYVHCSPHVTIERCFMHPGDRLGGSGPMLFDSPHATIHRCLILNGGCGLRLAASPHATITHNTISQTLGTAIGYSDSAKGTRQLNNSLCFPGNFALKFLRETPEDLAAFVSDYNNYGTRVRSANKPIKNPNPNLYNPSDEETLTLVNEEAFRLKDYRKGVHRLESTTKELIKIGNKRSYFSLKQWQEATGKDPHSIFADPLYANPADEIDAMDWRVEPGSPNIGAGENGRTIGALEAVRVGSNQVGRR
ncbi:MAG: right-handed parallel beta-helix repeat-containing protein [Kiritimatiellae bacterium]|nr:right-handed parallel beta-helix repeat-containing protein [Kiritimatiellia bacterium]